MISARPRFQSKFLVFSLLFTSFSPALPPAFAQAASDAKPADAKPTDAKPAATAGMSTTLPPLPADAHVEQTIQMEGKTLHYTVTVGTLPVRDSKGVLSGEVVYTSYVAEGKDRPVTFAFNGGPGAASVYLNLGAIGPKRVAFGAEGQSPSDPATLTDNPGTWLDFTDLVFIDPIGTGFSRSLVSEEESKKQFYGPDQD